MCVCIHGVAKRGHGLSEIGQDECLIITAVGRASDNQSWPQAGKCLIGATAMQIGLAEVHQCCAFPIPIANLLADCEAGLLKGNGLCVIAKAFMACAEVSERGRLGGSDSGQAGQRQSLG